MQQRFLSIFDDLKHKHRTPVQGIWVIHTDEVLLHQWLVDACRLHWQDNNQLAVRMELTSPKSWLDVLAKLNDLPLFGDNVAVIVSGNHKPDVKTLDKLARFADDVSAGHSANHLLWCLSKQDKKSLNTKALKLFDNEGLLIDGNINEAIRKEVLIIKARELGLTLTDDAWQMLLSHTEHNLLSAYQCLWRTSFLYTQAGIEELSVSLVDGMDFTVFHLSDNILTTNINKSLTILNHLKHTDTAPSIVLWALAKDARLILQIQSGKNPSELGIWQNKVHLYTNIAKRTQGMSGDWLSQIYAIDKAIKGVSGMDAWGELERLCLAMCGIR
ncbi:MAG: DNA polymerase III subunit delta [Moraxella sp.]|uniref:DNA polymerase III subunit delta n=1 Tax=Moraxella sp. TaxID=479 RepID=UPI0026DCF8E2|nr:DNA polymerase III subunit delta [Moraxella sp.]MDO4450425.1 DNA polymerase III subunit delta [Moraxella sp.]